MLRTVQLLPQKGPSTLAFDAGPPDSYPDRTHTGKRRRARTADHPFTRPPPIPLGAQTVPLTAINDRPGGRHDLRADSAGGLSADPSSSRVRDAPRRAAAGRVRRVPRAGGRGEDHHRAGTWLGAETRGRAPALLAAAAHGRARHLATIDPASEVPSPDLLVARL